MPTNNKKKSSPIFAEDVDGIATICKDCKWGDKRFDEQPCCDCLAEITEVNMSNFESWRKEIFDS